MLYDSNMHPLEQWRRQEQQRRGKPLRLYQLAAELECVPSRLTQVIRDGDRPGAELAIRIKKLTGISTDDIFAAAKAEDAK